MPDISTRPPKPKYLMFTTKKLLARAVPSSVQFAETDGGGVMIWMDFVPLAGPDGKAQQAQVYSAPDGGPREGYFADVPPGTTFRGKFSFSGGAKEHTIEKLRNAGWKGNSIAALGKGQLDGLGEVDCSITVDVEELDKDGEWLMLGEGEKRRFSPQMKVGFVNRVGGAGPKSVATVDRLAQLDQELGALLDPSAGPPKRTSAAATRPQQAAADAGPPGAEEDVPF